MKVYDISQEVVSCRIWPGHQRPEVTRLMSLSEGDSCNLTSFSMNNHNGTHMDAPAHFIKDGRTMEQMPVETFVGPCYVAHIDGEVTREIMASILKKAKAAKASCRILIGSDAILTPEAAMLLVAEGVILYGNEAQGVGNEDTLVEVHRILLGAGTVILEGAVLAAVPEGAYLLSAAPLNLAGCEGAPVRAVLIEN